MVAIDSYEPLLVALKPRAPTLAIRTVVAELQSVGRHIVGPANVILCMGDTLTHLPDLTSLETLFTAIAENLAPGGLFVATLRDYVSAPLRGDGRFLLVRSDENKIARCMVRITARGN